MTELPILVTLVLGFLGVIVSIFNQNKRFDDLKDSMNQRFNAVDRRFDAVDRRLEAVDRRFDEVLVRLDRIEDKQNTHEHRIMRLEEPMIRR